MPKIADCDRCTFYAHSTYLVCPIHPFGVDSDRCFDFRPNPNTEPEEEWAPEGTRFVDGQLLNEREEFVYSDRVPRQRWTREEKLELLDTHPLFTGRCPQCEMPFPKFEKPPVHWDCSHCGWLDDTV